MKIRFIFYFAISRLMAQEDDCMTCRVVGSTVLFGTGGYLGFETYRYPPGTPRIVLGGLSVLFLSLGAYRAITPVRPLDK